jgi:hypothetical protein
MAGRKRGLFLLKRGLAQSRKSLAFSSPLPQHKVVCARFKRALDDGPSYE